MKNSRAAFIPAILVAAAALALILYSFFGVTHHGGQPFPGGGGRIRPREDEGSGEMFKTLGTLAVFFTAASYAWLRLKKSRRSVSAIVRFLVRWFDNFHKYFGYAAVLLIAAHAVYFLTQAAVKKETYSGIAAFALLFTLGFYGFLIRRLRNKHLRKIHFGLATAFGVAAVIHAGGSAIMAVFGVAGLWSVVWMLERMAKKAADQAQEAK